MKKFLLFICVLFSTAVAQPSGYDIVLKGGRVMDPETNFDDVRNVGINGDDNESLKPRVSGVVTRLKPTKPSSGRFNKSIPAA